MGTRLSVSRLVSAVLLMVCLASCGGGAGTNPPPPPPPPVSVSVAPTSASPVLGATQQFTATVSGTANTAVTWGVNGTPGGSSATGTISAAGLYTAPQNLPANAGVTISAISVADATKSANAAVTVTSDIAVSVAPAAQNVELGASQTFVATVTSAGNPNRTVAWSVNGIPGGNATVGTVDANGAYTAPRILPTPAGVTLTATSAADASKSGSAQVSVTSNLTVAVNGPASVDNGATSQFNAVVTPVAGSNPDTSVQWSISGPGCSGTACGTITPTGFYTAPQVVPAPPTPTITATSVADPAKSGSVNITINSLIIVSVSPATANVLLEGSQVFTPTVSGTLDRRLVWDVDGIVGGNQATVGAVSNPGTGPTTYFAPVNMPAPRFVTVRATSQADPTKSASVRADLASAIGFLGVPGAAVRAVNRVLPLTIVLTGTTNPNFSLRVNGIPGGDLTVGRTCFAGSNPCFPITAAASGDVVDYQAPANIPAGGTVTLEVISQADPARTATAVITIVANVSVNVSPASVTLPNSAAQQFTATVVGSPNQNVTWSVAGTSCGGAPCGSIAPSGLYTAPANSPANATDTVTATSLDGAQTGSATVTLATGPFIRALHPASVTSGAAAGFTLKVEGNNFVLGSGATASEILLDGTAKATTCGSAIECTAPLLPADVATAGSRNVQVRNPDTTVSNSVSLVVDAATTTEEVIPLTAGAPAATNRNIVVVEPTTAGSGSAPLNLNIIGAAGPTGCTIGSGSIVVFRPAGGVVNVGVCVAGSNLSAADTFTLSGNDIPVVGVQTLGGGFLQVTLSLSSTVQTGTRTLFAVNANKDKTAATGSIEVK